MIENAYTGDFDDTTERFAANYILESSTLRDAVSIGEFMESEGLVYAEKHKADWEALRERIYHKIGTAELEIYWSEGR